LYSAFILEPLIFSPLTGQTVSSSLKAKEIVSIVKEKTIYDNSFDIIIPFLNLMSVMSV